MIKYLYHGRALRQQNVSHAREVKLINVSALFHWFTVALVALAYLSIESRGEMESSRRAFWTNIHLWVGVILIVFTLARFLWRSWEGHHTNMERSAIKFIARLSNSLLMVFLLVQPFLGVLTMNANGRDHFLLGSNIKISLIGRNEHMAEFLHASHQWVGNAFYFVIALHMMIGIVRLLQHRRRTVKSPK